MKKLILAATSSVVAVLLAGCRTPVESLRVTGDSPTASIEVAGPQSVWKSTKGDPLVVFFSKVDGQPFWKYAKTASSLCLPPGKHTMDVFTGPVGPRTAKAKRQGFDPTRPLSIEIDAKAGHNYRINAWAYDELSTSLWIDDIDTGECVTGRRPDMEAKP